MLMDFWQFSRNNTYVDIPGQFSEIHLHAWWFSNPLGNVFFLPKTMKQICPLALILLRTSPLILLRTFPHGKTCMQIDLWQFSRNDTYVSIPGKLSEIIYMHGCSPIHKKLSYSLLEFHVVRIWEFNLSHWL